MGTLPGQCNVSRGNWHGCVTRLARFYYILQKESFLKLIAHQGTTTMLCKWAGIVDHATLIGNSV